jgi:hypothetical protein
VLEPELRTKKGAHDFAQHLLTKAAERLRRGDYYCRRLGVHLSWVGDLGGFWDEIDFHETLAQGENGHARSLCTASAAHSRMAFTTGASLEEPKVC